VTERRGALAAAARVVGRLLGRADRERGPNGAGPRERADLVAFADAALTGARSVRRDGAAHVRLSLGGRPLDSPGGFLPPARSATVRVEVVGPDDDGHLERLLTTDVRDWLARAGTLPERPAPVTVPPGLDARRPAPFGSVLVAFGFRRLELFRDGRLCEIRPLGAPQRGGAS